MRTDDHLQLLPSTKTSKCLEVTTYHEISNEDLAALRAIAGVLYPGCRPGWIEFRGGDDVSKTTPPVSLEQIERLEAAGLLDEGDGMAWHCTRYITARGKQVVALMTGEISS